MENHAWHGRGERGSGRIKNHFQKTAYAFRKQDFLARPQRVSRDNVTLAFTSFLHRKFPSWLKMYSSRVMKGFSAFKPMEIAKNMWLKRNFHAGSGGVGGLGSIS